MHGNILAQLLVTAAAVHHHADARAVVVLNTVLEAVRLARLQNGAVRLVLLGDGSRAEEIRRLVTRHGLAGAVVTPGIVPHEHLPEYFHAADLYISCALSDGSSISLLEALATGLPVVVTDTEANREWVGEHTVGRLAPAGDGRAFAEGILHFVSQAPASRDEAARQNRRIATARADWAANVARLLQAYDDLHLRRRGAHVR